MQASDLAMEETSIWALQAKAVLDLCFGAQARMRLFPSRRLRPEFGPLPCPQRYPYFRARRF